MYFHKKISVEDDTEGSEQTIFRGVSSRVGIMGTLVVEFLMSIGFCLGISRAGIVDTLVVHCFNQSACAEHVSTDAFTQVDPPPSGLAHLKCTIVQCAETLKSF